MAGRKGNKTENSRSNIIYLILTLKNHSDRRNPLSLSEITKLLNKDFAKECGGNINRSTVYRILEDLYSDPLQIFKNENLIDNSYPEDINDPHNIGFYLRCVYKTKNGYEDIECLGDDPDKKVTKYYYYESNLIESELITLYDAIETYNYFSKEDIENISIKLSSIRPLSEKKIKYIPTPSDEALREYTAVLDNVSALAEIISHNNLARITYTYFDSKIRSRVKKGYPKIMRPLKLIWSNGYYYCITGISGHDNTVNLRIDRITEIEEIKASKKELEKYSGLKGEEAEYVRSSKSEYRAKHPVMFSGEMVNYNLLVNASANNMINTMVDIFGRDIKPSSADARTLKSHNIIPSKDQEWVLIRVKSTDDGMVLFATEYCRDVCIVAGPRCSKKVKETADRVKKSLSVGLSRYK